MLWSPGTAMSMMLHSFLFSIITMPGLLCSISVSVSVKKPHRIFYFPFSCTGSVCWEQHCSPHFIPTFLQRTQRTFFPFYHDVFNTDFLLTESKSKSCLTLSTFSLHNLRMGIHPGCQWHIILSSFYEPVPGHYRSDFLSLVIILLLLTNATSFLLSVLQFSQELPV